MESASEDEHRELGAVLSGMACSKTLEPWALRAVYGCRVWKLSPAQFSLERYRLAVCELTYRGMTHSHGEVLVYRWSLYIRFLPPFLKIR